VKRVLLLGLVCVVALFSFGQSLVKDICIGPGNSNPQNFVRVGNRTFFVANDAIHGYELWVTDGTETGTIMVKDINAGAADGCLYHGMRYTKASVLQALGKYVYFFAGDAIHGFELWRSDGTDWGTTMVKDIFQGPVSSSVDLNITRAGNFLFFAANDGKHGTELWKSDGTDTGTIVVKDIYPGPQSGNPLYLFADSDVVYFAANDNIHGYGLWKSNGTEDGTVFLKNVAPTGDAGDSIPFIKFKGELYFNGFSLGTGAELWKTNGTAAGTVMVKDINTGKGDGAPIHFNIVRDHIVFSAVTKNNGNELWQSDGTEAGTLLIKDIRQGTEGSNPGRPVVLGDKIYFVASDSENRTELWVSDLSDTGTQIFYPPVPTTGEHFKNLFADNQVIYFTTDSANTGFELWRTDGTTRGTVMMSELCQGNCSSEPAGFYKSDTTLFFSAYDETHGRELWGIGSNVTFIEEITSEALKDVYIDPLKRKLNQLRQTGSDITYIKIFDLAGSEIYTQWIKDPNQISSESFKPGIYILRAYDEHDDLVSFVRFVKE